MRAVIQRVKEASVEVRSESIAEIDKGLVVFLGVGKGDSLKDAKFLAQKVAEIRCFEDKRGKMNLSAKDIDAELLVVSEFTLYADLLRGRRPGFEPVASPEEAEELYRDFITLLVARGARVKEGRFKEHMTVRIANDGPVTFILDSRQKP